MHGGMQEEAGEVQGSVPGQFFSEFEELGLLIRVFQTLKSLFKGKC